MLPIGTKVLYKGYLYRVLGYSASLDAKGRRMIEINWHSYLAVSIDLLEIVDDNIKILFGLG